MKLDWKIVRSRKKKTNIRNENLKRKTDTATKCRFAYERIRWGGYSVPPPPSPFFHPPKESKTQKGESFIKI